MCVFFQIKYHEEFEKMKGTKITVADDPETLRAKKNMEIASQVDFSQKPVVAYRLIMFWIPLTTSEKKMFVERGACCNCQ